VTGAAAPMAKNAGLFGDTTALAELRAFVATTMTATCDVRTRTVVAGPGGSQAETWAAVATAIPCAFRPAGSPDEPVAADAVQAVTRYLVKLPPETAVTARDRLAITHGEAGTPDPLVLDVVGPSYKSTEVSRWVLATLAGAGGA
jgi:hypothetical protein